MWTYQLRRQRKIALALVYICLCVFASACQDNRSFPVESVQKTPPANSAKQSDTPTPGLVIQQQNESTPAMKPNSGSQFYFAMGSEPDGALRTPLVQQAPVKMLTSWYASHNDLTWITAWHSSFIPSLYARGYALQLVVWSGGPLVKFNTAYGPACGLPYPVSSQFLQDMKPLAKTFSDIMSLSDFQSFQSMETDSNVSDVLNMTTILHRWGKVLLSYYWSSPATFNADVHAMFTDTYMAKVMANGLFGFSFMTNENLSAPNSPLPFVVSAVRRYARS